MISTYIELPIELKQAIARYLDKHQGEDQDGMIAMAIALFLEDRKDGNPN